MATKYMMLSDVLAHITRTGLDREKARQELFACLRREELVARCETLGPRERWRAIAMGKGACTIPANAWECAELVPDTDNAVRFPKRWPEPGIDHGYDYVHGVHFDRSSVLEIWPDTHARTTSGNKRPPVAPAALESFIRANASLDLTKPELLEKTKRHFAGNTVSRTRFNALYSELPPDKKREQGDHSRTLARRRQG